jgi:hypothetical protein
MRQGRRAGGRYDGVAALSTRKRRVRRRARRGRWSTIGGNFRVCRTGRIFPAQGKGIAMVADNGKYQLSTEFVAKLIRTPLSGPSLRVLHTCLPWQSYKLGWSEEHVAAPDAAATWCRVAHLRSRLGLRSRDARTFRRAVAELARTRFFDDLRFEDRNATLHWQFAARVHRQMLSRTQRYTLLDLACIRNCRTSCDLALYALAAGVRGMKFPLFDLDIPALAASCPGAIGADGFLDWNRARRLLLPAAMRLARMLGATLVVQLHERARRPGITHLQVRLRPTGSLWDPEDLVKSAPERGTSRSRRRPAPAGKSGSNARGRRAVRGVVGAARPEPPHRGRPLAWDRSPRPGSRCVSTSHHPFGAISPGA